MTCRIFSSPEGCPTLRESAGRDRKSTRLNSSHSQISYAVFCLKKKKTPYAPLSLRAARTRAGNDKRRVRQLPSATAERSSLKYPAVHPFAGLPPKRTCDHVLMT